MRLVFTCSGRLPTERGSCGLPARTSAEFLLQCPHLVSPVAHVFQLQGLSSSTQSAVHSGAINCQDASPGAITAHRNVDSVDSGIIEKLFLESERHIIIATIITLVSVRSSKPFLNSVFFGKLFCLSDIPGSYCTYLHIRMALCRMDERNGCNSGSA